LVCPIEYAAAYRVFATVAYPRIKAIIENTVASGMVFLNSHAFDFQPPELRPYLDKYMRGSTALERVKLMKLP
jgi:4-hydroxyphenylacetate 3-monooxygenase